VETLLNYAEQTKNKKRIRIDYIRECILAKNPDVLTRLYELLNKNDDKWTILDFWAVYI
jgi:hypothetical protein